MHVACARTRPGRAKPLYLLPTGARADTRKGRPLSSQAHVIKPRMPDPPPSPELLLELVNGALNEMKAKDIIQIDVRGKTSIADFLIVASGTSTRHVKSIADEVVQHAKRAGAMPLGVEGEREAEWVLVDLGDVIVHVMLPRVREYYALERLWTVGDQPPGDDADASGAADSH